ncbi:MAG: 2-oxoglutarate dehydrogenase complex dihydrolipoyllysine-residue succinyltransferase [Verrucomicrobiota bacterium]|nr:2-oxoglutarate dehydrogenase complex dihydrolipoyllysine-residue succinyltransferase [Verrucomicrobiota bacterium]
MPTQIKVPAVGESIKTVYIAEWKKNTGDYCKAGDIICEIETDKASQEIPTEVSGAITTLAEVGDELSIGGVLATIDETVNEISSGQETTHNKPNTDNATSNKTLIPITDISKDRPLNRIKEILTTPSAKVHAEELGIELSEIRGSGKEGRILKEDVLAAAKDEKKIGTPTSIASNDNVGTASESVSTEADGATRKRMSMMRRTIANRLVSAQNEAAMLTTFNEADMSQIIDLRKKHQKRFIETHGVKLGYMSLFVKAVVHALKTVPNVNAAIDGNDIITYDQPHIGVAISTEKGLVVPVIRNSDDLSLAEIEKAIIKHAEKARSGNVELGDLTGGTFSITNGGIFGSMMSTPILNPPQSGILGMHTIQERPVALNGQVVIRPMMYLALTYDHRIIDGREAVTFLVTVKEFIENPNLNLID